MLFKVVDRCIPVGDITKYILHIDWAIGASGYMLKAKIVDGEELLLDLRSRQCIGLVSSFLGELDALMWALKAMKGI